MSQIRICDGCGNQLRTVPEVKGERRTLAFDWCLPCAKLAFEAVETARKVRDMR